jgi:hypothetical protein
MSYPDCQDIMRLLSISRGISRHAAEDPVVLAALLYFIAGDTGSSVSRIETVIRDASTILCGSPDGQQWYAEFRRRAAEASLPPPPAPTPTMVAVPAPASAFPLPYSGGLWGSMPCCPDK